MMNYNSKFNLGRRGQQEMVGFVLIVVIVVIGLLVFLLFGFRTPDVEESDIANNIRPMPTNTCRPWMPVIVK